MSAPRHAAAAVTAASVIHLAVPPPRPPVAPEPVEPPLNTDEVEVIKTLSLAARQRRLQRLADALGPLPANRGESRARDNRARGRAKHIASRRGRSR